MSEDYVTNYSSTFDNNVRRKSTVEQLIGDFSVRFKVRNPNGETGEASSNTER